MINYAITFPGQGSQSIGMLKELAAAFPLVKQTFEEAADALSFDLWKLVQEGAESDLNRTDNTQPAMLTAGMAVARVWKNHYNQQPTLLAGHSLGEYTALCFAGVFSFADAVKLVATRGKFMQAAVSEGEGAMAAILGLEDALVVEACKKSQQNQIVTPANYNGIGQVVIAGHKNAVERAISEAKQLGAKRGVLLPVSVPAHCALMKPAAEKLAIVLNEIKMVSPNVPVVHNVDVSTKTDPEEIKKALIAQLSDSVRWTETVQYLAKQEIELVLELGPGKVLTGINKRVDKNLNTLPVFDPQTLEQALKALGA
jgi:[acyl-carrier-protein] S-malonyltransferase